MTNEQAFAKARALTADNHHQAAVLTIAKHFKLANIAGAVSGIIMVHKWRGHMDPPMIEMMQIIRQELYEAVEATHGPDVRKAVCRCL